MGRFQSKRKSSIRLLRAAAALLLAGLMIRALQKTDPRCEAQALTSEEAEGLQQLQAALGV